MALLTPAAPAKHSSAVVSYVTPTATTGDTFRNTGRELVLLKNGSASPVNVTLKRPGASNYGVVADVTVAVAAGVTRVAGPFSQAAYNDPDDGLMTVIFASVTDNQIAVVRGR